MPKSCVSEKTKGVLQRNFDAAEDHRGRSSRKIIAKDHREKVSIIIAGYKDDIENKLYSFNPGMASRFKSIQEK
jgi:hypothetical protein